MWNFCITFCDFCWGGNERLWICKEGIWRKILRTTGLNMLQSREDVLFVASLTSFRSCLSNSLNVVEFCMMSTQSYYVMEGFGMALLLLRFVHSPWPVATMDRPTAWLVSSGVRRKFPRVNQSIVVAKGGPKGPCPPKCLENIVILYFERHFSTQNSAIRLKLNILVYTAEYCL